MSYHICKDTYVYVHIYKYTHISVSYDIISKAKLHSKSVHISTDWIEWLQQGEGISQYIPTDPESYYGPGGRGGGKDGVWKGWDYWLGTGGYRNHSL